MLASFLERGNVFASLSRSQMFEVETQFTLYLVKAQGFNETVTKCERVLDDDQIELYGMFRAKLAEMISDPDCNCKFKPAILQLANGNRNGFIDLDVSPKRIEKIIDAHTSRFASRVSVVCHPIDEIGPVHVHQMEQMHMAKIKSHTKKFVSSKTRFLTMGDPCLELGDIVNDLNILALRAMRSYYPFRTGTHMENTMRSTVTNRGSCLIKYHTATSRRRVLQTEDGSYAREITSIRDVDGHDVPVLNLVVGNDPRETDTVLIDLKRAAASTGVLAIIAQFILNVSAQDEFQSWLGEKIVACNGAGDIAEAVFASGRTYEFLLSKFLSLPLNEVALALHYLRQIAT